MSEFQSELVSLAAAVNGEYFWSNSNLEYSKKMAVKEADQYVRSAFAKFLRKSRRAATLGADESSIVWEKSCMSLSSDFIKQKMT